MIKQFVDCNRLFGTSCESIDHYNVIDKIDILTEKTSPRCTHLIDNKRNKIMIGAT